MATKRKRGTKDNPLTATELQEAIDNFEQRDYVITEATIKDGFCNYSYEKTRGIGIGDIHKVNGKAGTVHDDMYNAFAEFNVHMAILDDVFKHSGVEFESLEEVKNHELTGLYIVSGFKIKGSEDNKSIILTGSKYISSGGRIELEIPKISIDSLSSYKWFNELKEAADNALEEVALYAEGKMIPVKEDDPEEKPSAKQMSILDQDNADPDFDSQEQEGEF